MSGPTDMHRAISQAADIAQLKESSRNSERDRSNIWQNLDALREIAGQNSLILSKIEDLTAGQKAVAAALSDHETKINVRLTALETRDARGQGAMAVLLTIAGAFGSVITFLVQWALAHLFPSSGHQ